MMLMGYQYADITDKYQAFVTAAAAFLDVKVEVGSMLDCIATW